MKKAIAILFACIILILALTGCDSRYNKDEFLGKTSAEIIDDFGSFDCVGMPADGDGLYKNCRCGYTIREHKMNLFGSSPEILFLITFDEHAIAIACEEGYRPGG